MTRFSLTGRKRLLSSNNKLEKAFPGYRIKGLTFSPVRTAGRGNVCPNAGICANLCVLRYAGRMVQRGPRMRAIERTRFYYDSPELFTEQLHHELHLFAKLAERQQFQALCRLNVASDLDWREVAAAHPNVWFYDYTKRLDLMEASLSSGSWPSNYELTLSANERIDWTSCALYLLAKRNVSVVFDTPRCGMHHIAHPLPATYRGFPVIDGDDHDVRMRLFDGFGHIVGLRFKAAGCTCKRNHKGLLAGLEAGFIHSAWEGN